MHRSEYLTGEGQPDMLIRGIGISPARVALSLIAAVMLLIALSIGPATSRAASLNAPQEPPMILPAKAGASAAGGGDSAGWIIGGVPGGVTDRIAKASGATVIDRQTGSYRISRGKARTLANRLRKVGRLAYAEPDVPVDPSGYPLDLFSDEQWWLNRIVSPGDVTPPAVTGKSPMIAVIEESLDPLHPDLASANLSGAKSLGPEADWHGTAVAGIIGSPGEMLGIRGVWPGAKMRLFAYDLTCSTASRAVFKAVDAGASVINMSYTFPANKCFTHFEATQYAIRKNVVAVAAAGNTGDSGNAAVRPASDPHVLSVGAVDNESQIASFSTRNAQVDITAPGDKVYAPYEEEETAGGSNVVKRTWAYLSGTSFSAPMVSATAAWLRQVRPNLGNLQINKLLTNSATDLGDPGRDPEYGAGLLSVEKSLSEPTPVQDPYEPNDDIRWINGSLLGIKSPYLWRAGSGKRRMITATLSRAKDPADVYRLMIPARRKIIANVTQLEGDIVLSALKPNAKSIYKPGKNLIVRSDRSYPKTEGILVRNLKKRPQTIWLAITPSASQTGNDSTYRLKVARR